MESVALVVAIIVVAGIFYLARPAVLFVIKYKNGQKSVRGDVSSALVSAIDDICRQNGITSGTITGVPVGKQFRMTFSNDIPQGCQQQIRNLLLSGAYKDIRLSSR